VTKYELIEILNTFPGDPVIVLSRDEEGNGYLPLWTVDDYIYNERTGEIGFDNLTPQLKKQGYTQEDLIEGVPALVLWPA